MAKTRVYELARDLGVESKDLLTRADELGIEVKTASSGLDEEQAGLLRLSFQEDRAVGAVETEPTAAPPEEEPLPDVEAEPEPPVAEVAEEPVGREVVTVESGITAEELATQLGRSTGEVVKALLQMGEMVAAIAPVPDGALELIGDQFGVDVEVLPAPPEPAPAPAARRERPHYDDDPDDMVPRPPVVTVMGHVDHGKTTLLDHIRQANVVAGEHGGITQHIGAYQVDVDGRKITFIDTPGHEAFTALRARGADVTDIVVLVVAAEDGVMPQTVEAISHATAAGVKIVVAINKVDLPDANPAAVRAQLTEHELVPEELGGDTITVEVSAKTGLGVDQLLEMIDLVAQLEEFKANPKAAASGVVVESQLDRGRGPVASVIVQRGTLRPGDALVAGATAGRVRAMLDEHGAQLKQAPPGTPVLTMGWDDVPDPGEFFEVVESEKVARSLAQERQGELRSQELVVPSARERLEQLLEQLRTAEEAELRLIIKADAHGSLEAIEESVRKIAREGGRITVVHGAVGGISENDVTLGDVTESVVVGFNVRPDAKGRKAAEEAGVEIRTYRVIYELLQDIEQMLVGRLAPVEVETILGSAEVRAIFRVPRAGNVAGCYVTEGEMVRGAKARLVRQGVVVYDGSIASLRRFKDDVRTVSAGFECGVGLYNFDDIKEDDVIEAYQVTKQARE